MGENVKSVCDLISRWARESPDHPAILFGPRVVSYQELDNTAARIAHILLDHQVRPGDFVPVLATRSCEMVASFLGVLKAGACYVPVDIEAWAEDNIVSTLKRVSARVVINLSASTYPDYHVITQKEIENAFKPITGGDKGTQDELPQARIQPEDLAYMVFTSGTTSKPKGVMIPHRALLNYVQQGDEEAPFNSCPRPEDKSLLTFSPGFDACAGVVFSTLCNGAQLMVAGISEFEKCAAQANIIAVTPSMLSAILDVESCSHLRLVIIGGEAPTQRLIQRWSAPGRTLYNGYGPTETTISSIMGKIIPGKPITLGRPMNNSRVVLLDGDTESDYGEICITGPGLATGYYQDEALTSQKFIYRDGERMYRTGDFARRTEHGLEFAGRADSFVKNRGFLVNLDSQVIPLLLENGAHTATAFMHRDRLIAFVTPEDLDARALRQNLARSHDPILIPDQIRALPVIPLTPNGKANNRALRELLDQEVSESLEDKEGDGSDKLSKMEILRMAISAAASLPRPDIHDDQSFSDLGGNSLAALKVLSYLGKRHFRLRLPDLFNLPDLNAICNAIRYDKPEAGEGTVEDSGPNDGQSLEVRGPMTILQAKMIQASLKTPGANCMLLRIRMRHPGEHIDQVSLKEAWRRVLSRHTIFRTTFLLQDEIQEVQPSLDFHWTEEETTLDQQDEIIRAQSLRIRDQILSAHTQGQRFVPVNVYHLITVPGVGSTLLVAGHHAQADGWSFSIILDEVQAVLLDKSLPIENPPQFTSIAKFQKKQQEDTEGIEFWKNILKDHLTLPNLTLPRPPPENIPSDWTSSLKLDLNFNSLKLGKAARALSVAPSTLLYTAWGLVLSNYTSCDHVAFGVVFSGRNIAEVPDVEHAVGPLLNTVPFPVEFETEQTVQGVLSKINNRLLQMLEFQWSAPEAMESMPGESINRTLQTLVVTEYDLPPTEDPMSWSIEREDLMEFGLTLLVETASQVGDGNANNLSNNQDQSLQARMLYDSARYTSSTVQKLLCHFKNALESLMEPQNRNMENVRSQLMSEEEKSTLLQSPAAFNGEYDLVEHGQYTTIKDAFEEAATRWPELCAIESAHNGNLSYRELNRLSNIVAQQLREYAKGKAPGSVVVGVLSDGSLHWVIAILAVLKAGFVCCPIDISLPASRIQVIITESGATVFLAANRVCLPNFESSDSRTIGDNVVVVNELVQHAASVPVDRFETVSAAKDTIYLVFTSGSTGVPKGVPLHNTTVLNALSVPAVRLSAAPGRRISQLSALGFDMVLVEVFGSLCYGATLVLKDPGNPFDHIKHVNAMVTTPSFLSVLSPDEYPNLDTVLLAGEPVDQALADKWSNRIESLVNVYGPSECGCASATRLLPGDRVSIGRALYGLKFYILDHRRSLVPQGITGEIYISGEQVTRGYWGATHHLNTKSSFIPNPYSAEAGHDIMYRTGDLGFWNENMNISYVGRIDNQVKVRGFRVELEEVESALIAADKEHVQSAAAIAIKSDSGGGAEDSSLRVVGFVTPASIDVANISAQLATLLPGYARPSRILAIPNLPVTANLKLDREKLRYMVIASQVPSVGDTQEHTVNDEGLNPTEKIIAESWRKLLGSDERLRTISRGDDFMSLGGNSILAIKSARAITERIGHNVPIALLLRETVLWRLARAIDDELKTSSSNPDAPSDSSFASYLASVRRGGDDSNDPEGALSHLELEMYQAHAASTTKSIFNTATHFSIAGPVDIKKLSSAFIGLARDNPLLRARYIISQETPIRLISSEYSEPQCFSGNAIDIEGLQALVNKPFDLANEQLVKVIIWNKDTESRHTELIIVAHHIITDKVSLSVMLAQISSRYQELGSVDHELPRIDNNKLSANEGNYIDWARWLKQRGDNKAGTQRQSVQYWEHYQQRLPQAIPPLQDPSSGQSMSSYAPARVEIIIPPLIVGSTAMNAPKNKYSQRIGVAAVALGLRAVLGISRARLGVPYVNRDEPGTGDMLGLFVDRLPILISLDDMNLVDAEIFLAAVSAEINRAVENQLPYAEIQSIITNGAEDSKKSNDGGVRELIDVMVVYGWQSDSLAHSLSLGPEVEVREASDGLRPLGSMFALEIEYLEGEDGTLHVNVQYDARKISPEQITALRVFLPTAVQRLARQLPPASILSAHKVEPDGKLRG